MIKHSDLFFAVAIVVTFFASIVFLLDGALSPFVGAGFVWFLYFYMKDREHHDHSS